MADENKTVHGNSKESEKLQHLYEIKDKDLPEDDDTYKFGISGSALNADGTSKRANSQVNKLNEKFEKERFEAEILEKDIPNRQEALQKEEEKVEEYQIQHNKKMPPGMEKPNSLKRKNKL